jgi:hypothetical protein
MDYIGAHTEMSSELKAEREREKRMSDTTQLTITAEDVRFGQRASSRDSPEALALARQFGGRWSCGAICAADLDSVPDKGVPNGRGGTKRNYGPPRRQVMFGRKLSDAITAFDTKGVPMLRGDYELLEGKGI